MGGTGHRHCKDHCKDLIKCEPREIKTYTNTFCVFFRYDITNGNCQHFRKSNVPDESLFTGNEIERSSENGTLTHVYKSGDGPR